MAKTGKISSVYTGSCVDGAGIRCVVFFSGCNLNCPFCHNPETLFLKGTLYTPERLAKKLLRFLPYLKNGGVTLSGGEPFLQAEFCIELVKILKNYNVNIAIETNAHIINPDLIKLSDLIIADIKNYDKIETIKVTGFLDCCLINKKRVKITNVIIPGINDSVKKLTELKNLLKPYSNISVVEFLPFKKLCVSKYENLNKPFPYINILETSDKTVKNITKTYFDLI